MIYFVRHGVTDWNENITPEGKHSAKCQGRADIPLNQNGINQAKELAKNLKDIKFDKVFCSPLSRTKQTCEIILGSLDGVVFDERIIERDFGEFEGLTKEEFDFTGFCDKYSGLKFEKAETVNSIEDRVFSFLDELKDKTKPDENVLIVAHGGVGCMFLSYFEGIPEDGNYNRPFFVPHSTPIIKDFNDIKHS